MQKHQGIPIDIEKTQEPAKSTDIDTYEDKIENNESEQDDIKENNDDFDLTEDDNADDEPADDLFDDIFSENTSANDKTKKESKTKSDFPTLSDIDDFDMLYEFPGETSNDVVHEDLPSDDVVTDVPTKTPTYIPEHIRKRKYPLLQRELLKTR